MNLQKYSLDFSSPMPKTSKLIFDSFDTVKLSLRVMNELLKNIKFNKVEMKKAVDNSYATSTDLANWLVQNLGYTFRSAYKLTGKIVNYASKKNKILEELSIAELKKFDKNITVSAQSVLTTINSMKNKTSFGGTSPQSVNKSIQYVIKKYL